MISGIHELKMTIIPETQLENNQFTAENTISLPHSLNTQHFNSISIQ